MKNRVSKPQKADCKKDDCGRTDRENGAKDENS